MPAAFLTQFAAGCFLAIAVSDIHRSGWRYLRLMAIVSISLAFVGGLLHRTGAGLSIADFMQPATLLLVAGLVVGIVWLFVNAAQQETVTSAQRWLPLIAGLALLSAAVLLSVGPDTLLGAGAVASDATIAQSGGVVDGASATLWAQIAPVINTVLGALLLGVLTAAMLLGHRYLTDTQMPIAPLRRLTTIYLAVFAVRAVWSVAHALPVWLTDFRQQESALFFQIVLLARLGVGILATAVFAYMVWDCVRRRATQSATAMFYLSMVLVFIGELAGQFLMRTEGLAL